MLYTLLGNIKSSKKYLQPHNYDKSEFSFTDAKIYLLYKISTFRFISTVDRQTINLPASQPHMRSVQLIFTPIVSIFYLLTL